MQKVFNRIQKYFKKSLFILVFLLLVTPAIYKLIRPGFFPMYDDMQVIRLEQMDECVKDGQIPCRWVPNLGYGYGYPLFQYYAPLPYYLMEIFHLIGFSFIASVKIGFILSIILSGYFFFLLASLFFSKEVSLASTALYVYVPIRAADLYVRGAMGELWGMVFLPLLLYGVEKAAREKCVKATSYLGISLFLFLISHNLTVLMSIPLIFIWLVFIFIRFKKNIKIIFKYLLTGFVLGILLSSFFTIPLIFEKNLVYVETTTQGYFNYLAHFVDLYQLFISRVWGYGPSILGTNDEVSFSVGQLQIILFIAAAIIILIGKKFKEKYFFVGLIILNIFYLFLIHQRSTFIWKFIPFMAFIQFPWRFLTIISLITAFISGFVISNIKGRKKLLFSIGVIILSIILYAGYFTPKNWLKISDKEKLSGENYMRQITASIYDYLPKSAKYAPKNIAPESVEVVEGKAEIQYFKKGSNWFKFVIVSENDGVRVVIPSYDFPGWKAWKNNSRVRVERWEDLGLLSIVTSKGKSEIYVKLTNSLPRKVGDFATLLGIIFLTILLTKKNYVKKFL